MKIFIQVVLFLIAFAAVVSATIVNTRNRKITIAGGKRKDDRGSSGNSPSSKPFATFNNVAGNLNWDNPDSMKEESKTGLFVNLTVFFLFYK